MHKETPKEKKFRRRADARPDELLDAALALFSARGYDATRMEDIAARAGVSKGSVYRYFASKQALMEGLVKRAIAPIAHNAFGMISAFEGNPRDLITLILSMVAHRLSEPGVVAVPKLIVREAAAFPEIAAAYREQVIDLVLPVFVGMIQKGMNEGYFRKLDAEMVARSVMGPLVMHLLLAEIFQVVPADGLSFDRLVSTHLHILFDGLSVPGTSGNTETSNG